MRVDTTNPAGHRVLRRWAAGGLLAAVLLAAVGPRAAAADDPPKPADPGELDRLRRQVADLARRLAALEERAAPAPPVRVDPPDDEQKLRRAVDAAVGQLGGLSPELRQRVRRQVAEAIRRAAAAGAVGGPEFDRLFRVAPLSPPGRPRLGVTTGEVPDLVRDHVDLPPGVGLVVTDVADGSPAAKAGVRPNDVLVKFAGTDVSADGGRFAAAVAAAPAGAAELEVVRKGKREQVTVDLPAPPDPPAPPGAVEIEVQTGGRRTAFDQLTMTAADGKFEVKAAAAGVTYELTGEVKDGRPTLTKAVVDGTAYPSVGEVPEGHRPAVRQLLGLVGRPGR